MTKEIEEIVDDAKRLSLRPVSLGNSSGLSGQQRKAVWEAESGLCFWRRTDLEAVEKIIQNMNEYYFANTKYGPVAIEKNSIMYIEPYAADALGETLVVLKSGHEIGIPLDEAKRIIEEMTAESKAPAAPRNGAGE
ncbi:MAG: hypothetical protein ACYS30_24340 [Planctomycetota bacterium]